MKKIIGLIFILVLIPSLALAASFKQPDDGSVTVGAGENLNDLYTAGGNVNINSKIGGDLLVAGGNIDINEGVEEDLLIVGGNISVGGDVGGDVRALGGNITINGNVSGDISAAGGEITIVDGSTVTGDIVAVAGTVLIDGTVNGTVYLGAAGNVKINGTVNGSVIAKNVDKVELSSDAQIKGDLEYHSPNQATIADGAIIQGETKYTKIEAGNRFKAAGPTTGAVIISALMSLAALLLFVLVFPGAAYSVAQRALTKPLNSLGIGLLGLIGIPIVLLLALITILGIKLALLGIFGYVFVLILANFLTALVIGSLIFKYIDKSASYPVDWRAVIGGILVTTILTVIPVIGWLAYFIAFLISLGALLYLVWQWGRSKRTLVAK